MTSDAPAARTTDAVPFPPRTSSLSPALVLAMALLAIAPASGQSVASGRDPSVSPEREAAVDAVFAEWRGTHTPGCAVAVGQDGRPVLQRAYGMADLEHRVPNTPGTIFEPGSVAKQVTAAATVLLSLDGALSLDDDIRTWIPELPVYERPVTIRHLLNHTSGLRDWGAVAGIEGWPRTTRVHDHDHVLDILSRQESLNYAPGDFYSYTNSGYNLQAILVERVSGVPFVDFTRERIFEPLGMTRTEWRDDYRRVVPDRAVAYEPVDEGFRMDMPFENVHGNGGLLTTVEDLLRFTGNLETGEVGGPRFLEAMHRQGVLTSGRTISYASGLFVDRYRGLREVAHSGSTAGYRGWLGRYPDEGVSVAVMCNAASANATALAHGVADLFLVGVVDQDAVAGVAFAEPDRAAADAQAGGYRSERDHTFQQVDSRDGALRLGARAYRPTRSGAWVAEDGSRLEFQQAGGEPRAVMVRTAPDGDVERWAPVPEWSPSAREVEAFAGRYRSVEAEVTWTVEAEDGRLEVRDRYGRSVMSLEPVYTDVFRGAGTTVRFLRGSGGVEGLSVIQGRVWDLRFRRER